MPITIPELALVVLVGPSGAGKSTFARTHFKPTEVLSSDFCRGLVSDDENDQSATSDAFEVLHYIARKRLAAGRLTVIDATNVQVEARKPLNALAREFHVLAVAIVFDLPERLCQERNRARPDRDFGPHVIRRQIQDLRRSLRGLEREGFRYVFTLETPEQAAAASITRTRLWTDRRDQRGPFDIIGDIHGCADELRELLDRLGYQPTTKVADKTTLPAGAYVHPEGRTAVFLGDPVDRGPNVPEVLRLVGGAHQPGRRGDGGQTDRLCSARAERAGPAGGEVPWARVSTHHLRPRIYCTCQPGSASPARPRCQAITCAARVRAGAGRIGALRAQ
jgi:protein phosphatase